MPQIIKIHHRKTELCEQKGSLTLNEMQRFIGGYIEAVYKRFPDKKIVILCDEDGLSKGLPLTLTINGTSIYGPCIIAQSAGDNLVGLTPAQIEMAMKETWWWCKHNQEWVKKTVLRHK